MKNHILVLILLCYSLTTWSQQLPVDEISKKVSYSAVVESQGQMKKQLFDRAKKWILSRNSTTNPYSITFENDADGNIAGKGSFLLAAYRRDYVILFTINIMTKDGRSKYELTDFIIQYHAASEAKSGGFGYFSKSSYKAEKTYEYSIETFYPSRLDSRKPNIEYYEAVNGNTFKAIDAELQNIIGSLKQALSVKEDW